MNFAAGANHSNQIRKSSIGPNQQPGYAGQASRKEDRQHQSLLSTKLNGNEMIQGRVLNTKGNSNPQNLNSGHFEQVHKQQSNTGLYLNSLASQNGLQVHPSKGERFTNDNLASFLTNPKIMSHTQTVNTTLRTPQTTTSRC